MAVNIDFTGRFEAAFGSIGLQIATSINANRVFGFGSFEALDETFEDVILSYQEDGQPKTDLKFASFPFATGGGTQDVDSILAPPPICSFSRAKELITTPLNNLDTEVVERWNTRGYQIRLTGILVDMANHNNPTDLVNAIHKLFEFNGVLEVSGTQFFEKDIYYLYLSNIEINGVVGYQDTVRYTITANSTREVNFTLTNPNT